MKHFDDADLLQAWALGESDGSLGSHLEACLPCRERQDAILRALDEERRDAVHRMESKPEAFWDRQRAGVMERIAERRHRGRSGAFRGFAWALAATLVLLMGLSVVRFNAPAAPDPVAVTETAPLPDPAVALPSADPWQADALTGYSSAVDWESWLEPSRTGGDA